MKTLKNIKLLIYYFLISYPNIIKLLLSITITFTCFYFDSSNSSDVAYCISPEEERIKANLEFHKTDVKLIEKRLKELEENYDNLSQNDKDSIPLFKKELEFSKKEFHNNIGRQMELKGAPSSSLGKRFSSEDYNTSNKR